MRCRDALPFPVGETHGKWEERAAFRLSKNRRTRFCGGSLRRVRTTGASRCAGSEHLVSAAGLCPRLDESAGKRRSTRLRKGAPWLKPVLLQCARGAARTRRTYTRAPFLRMRRGAGR
ncbi:MAG: hypothetical protein EXR79_17305 [Myxococcales bacterium]|nr:hypothetical protein [Myxococcales bacterium]